jgi:hypothetical protein
MIAGRYAFIYIISLGISRKHSGPAGREAIASHENFPGKWSKAVQQI